MKVDKFNSYNNNHKSNIQFGAKVFNQQQWNEYAPTIKKYGGKFISDYYELRSDDYFYPHQVKALKDKVKWLYLEHDSAVDIMLEPSEQARLDSLHIVLDKKIRENRVADNPAKHLKVVEESGLYDAWSEILGNVLRFANQEKTKLKNWAIEAQENEARLNKKFNAIW